MMDVFERLARKWIECWRQEPGGVSRRLYRSSYETARVVVRHVWRRLHGTRHLMKGRRILRRYSAHYRQAQHAYRLSDPSREAPAVPLQDLGVRVVTPSANSWFRLPSHHDEAVARVAASVEDALAWSANCRFVPRLSSSSVPDRTDALTDLAEARLLTIQLRAPLSLDGLAELCEPLVAELETKLFATFTIVDKVYAYRSPVSRQKPSASWMWHYDNHPREMLKVMVYLTDVSDVTAPFEYIRHRATKKPLIGEPLAPLHHHSRMAPGVIERCLADGYEIHRITGPRGTVVVFDDNVVHRGTLATGGHRDVVVFQVRPATFDARPRIDPRWTGSFLHEDVNRDPYDVTPRLKRREAT